jgi:hypothetical protein
MTHALVRTKARIALVLVALVVLVATMVTIAGALTSSSAPITKFSAVDEVVFECTTSSTFVNMPDMRRNFIFGGSTNDQAMVTFSGSLSLDDSGGTFDTGFIRLRIDGAQQTPGEVPAIGVNERGMHAFSFQTGTLTPGMHTAQIQWRTDLGSSFCVDARSLIILSK